MDNSRALPAPDSRLVNAIPFFVAAVATGICLLILVTGVMQATGGFFSYPLDDPYIHMQIAKTLAFDGTWGIKPGDFESASSSLFYPLLLAAAFRLFGAHHIIPLWLNLVAGVWLLFVANRWLLKLSFSVLRRTIILLLAAFLMPLPAIISTGMEHCFQTLSAFLFLTALADQAGLAGEKNQRRLQWKMPVYAILVSGFRYEGLFLIAAGVVVLLWYRQYRDAMLVLAAGLLPVVIFGLCSVSKGSYFLPNSVMLKSYFPVSTQEYSGFARLLFNHFMLGPMVEFPNQICFLAVERLLFVLPLLYMLLKKQLENKNKSGADPYLLFIPALFLCTLLHLVLASTSWFFRYEAYLIFCAAIVVPAVLYQIIPEWLPGKDPVVKLFAAALLLLLVAPAFVRSGEAFLKNKTGCVNIFEQQCQSARFIRQYYNHSVVAIIDIGAVSFFSDAEIVDLQGLANADIARHWKQTKMFPEYIDTVMKENKVAFALVTPHFREDYFQRWVPVATLEISHNFSCGNPVVKFYVPEQKDKAALQSNIRSFQTAAPRSIRFTYF